MDTESEFREAGPGEGLATADARGVAAGGDAGRPSAAPAPAHPSLTAAADDDDDEDDVVVSAPRRAAAGPRPPAGIDLPAKVKGDGELGGGDDEGVSGKAGGDGDDDDASDSSSSSSGPGSGSSSSGSGSGDESGGDDDDKKPAGSGETAADAACGPSAVPD